MMKARPPAICVHPVGPVTQFTSLGPAVNVGGDGAGEDTAVGLTLH